MPISQKTLEMIRETVEVILVGLLITLLLSWLSDRNLFSIPLEKLLKKPAGDAIYWPWVISIACACLCLSIAPWLTKLIEAKKIAEDAPKKTHPLELDIDS